MRGGYVVMPVFVLVPIPVLEPDYLFCSARDYARENKGSVNRPIKLRQATICVCRRQSIVAIFKS